MNKNEKLELIRQAEKSNFTEEDTQLLIDWAIHARLDIELLNLIFKGCVEVTEIKDGEPAFRITERGKRAVESNNVEENRKKNPDNY